MPKFETARFHHTTGPRSLFERARFVMGKHQGLKLHGAHFKQRADERKILPEYLADFYSDQWKLVDVEVRIDTGKFVACGFSKLIEGRSLYIVVGFADTVKTAIWKDGDTPGGIIVREGPLYTRVESVNAELMRNEPP